MVPADFTAQRTDTQRKLNRGQDTGRLIQRVTQEHNDPGRSE